MYSWRKSTQAPDIRLIILFRLLNVTLNLSETERKTSEFEINHTNANTCLWSGIGGLPNECRCGTLPVAWTTLHRPSIALVVIRK